MSVRSAGGTIAKLEALLDRVRARAAQPRASREATPVAVPPVPVPITDLLDGKRDQATVPPISLVELAPAPSPSADVEVTVELTSEDAFVAASPAVDIGPAPEPPPAEMDAPEIEQVSEEFEEEPPVSSRRPVEPETGKGLAELAFGAEEPSPERHAPPPESGKVPAAPAVQVSVVDEFDVDPDTKVRELVPEAVRAELASNAEIVEVVGPARQFAPVTFADLLDASLSL